MSFPVYKKIQPGSRMIKKTQQATAMPHHPHHVRVDGTQNVKYDLDHVHCCIIMTSDM